MIKRWKMTRDKAEVLRNAAPANQLSGLEALAIEPFCVTGTIVPTAAGTAVELIPDEDVGAGRKIFITAMVAKVNGATALSGGTGTLIAVMDKAASPVTGISIAVAALTANALLGLHTANVTVGDAVALGSGFSEGKGLVLKGDNNFGAGSNVVVTLTGFIAES